MKLTIRLLLLSFGVLLLANASGVSASGTPDLATCAGNAGSAEEDIAACTRSITSGQLSTKELAMSYLTRGIAWMYKEDYDKAIADCNEAIRLDPQYALAYYGRGIIWQKKGDNDKAIADFNEVVRLDPQNALAYYARGDAWRNKEDYDKAIADYNEVVRLNPKDASASYARSIAWRNKGDYDKAISDYNEVIRLNPQNALAYYGRGIIRFDKGEFFSAASDLAQSQKLKPNTYTAIWLYLARVPGNIDGKAELTLNTQSMDKIKWPAPVVALYLGKADPNTVLSQAADPDPKKLKELLCEANFYLGEWHLLRHEKQKALPLFIKAQNDCPKSFTEYSAAVSELKRLK